MKKHHLLIAILSLFCFSAQSEEAKYNVAQIGGVYIESPKSKDKKIFAMGTFNHGEKVEAHAVISFGNRMIVNERFLNQEDKLIATGLKSNKEKVNIGPANFSTIFNTSDDRRSGGFRVSIDRLPESKLTGVVFSGTIPVTIAKSTKKFTHAGDIKAGVTIQAGNVAIKIKKIEADAITFKTNTSGIGIASVTAIQKNGIKVKTESSSTMKESSSEGASTTSAWQFSQPIGAISKIELEVFQDMEAIDVPVSLMVMRPFN